ncbi:MAG: ion transporter [Cyclobacteriaceae bacterium]|nr:ion transporter [Cyclobacteriaceae bacterium]
MNSKKARRDKWRKDLYVIIFEADTYWGKFFDVGLLITILLSVAVVLLESVESISNLYKDLLLIIEWFFTLIFTLEYLARIMISPRPKKYFFSFFGIVDLLSILPTYLGLVFTGAHALLVIRSIRLLRVFRIFKLVRFLGEASQLAQALKASRAKITVFLGSVFILVVILGSIMYLIEGRENGFTSIPRSIYWAIVTLTTVGYGDIAPQTVIGQTLASLIMILGYGIIAVPTGIVTAEISQQNKTKQVTSYTCNVCNTAGHDKDARYCKMCGSELL